MRHIHYAKAALSVGGVLAIYHIAWLSLVAAGCAKAVMDFVLKLHFIRLDYQLLPFDLTLASGLVVVTFTVGALIGLIFAAIWNWLGRGRELAGRSD